MHNPPVKSRHVVYLLCNSKLCYLHWVGFFNSDNFSNEVEKSFHWQHICQPAVVLQVIGLPHTVICWSVREMAVNTHSHLHYIGHTLTQQSHWQLILYLPPTNSTWYSLVSIIGFAWALHMMFSLASQLHATTWPLAIWSPLGSNWWHCWTRDHWSVLNLHSMLCGCWYTVFHLINGSDKLENYTHSLRS